MNPAAPASRAPHRASSSSKVVNIRIGGASPVLTSDRVAVTPSRRRMRTSISTRSGRWAATAAMTWSPSSHSATTSKPSSGAQDAGGTGAHDRLVVDDDDPDHRQRPAPGRRRRAVAAPRPANRRRSDRRPGPRRAPRARSRMPTNPKWPSSGPGRRGSTAMVGDDEPDLVGVSVEIHGELDPVSRGVAGHVRQRLPADPVHGRTDRPLDARRRRDTRALTSRPARGTPRPARRGRPSPAAPDPSPARSSAATQP